MKKAAQKHNPLRTASPLVGVKMQDILTWKHLFQFFLMMPVILFFFLGMGIVDVTPAHAAPGLNRVINFQGRVVKKSDGTNVADGTYSFTFKLYDAASNGNLLWQETQSSVSVTNGIFQVALGSSTGFNQGGYNVDFTQNNLYLDITFNSETFGTRVQLASVPQAIDAEQLSGVVATQSASGFTLTGGLSNAKNITFSNSLTFAGTDSTTMTFPSTSTTVAGLSIAQTFTSAQTISPTAASAVGLTVNGTTNSTSADVLDVVSGVPTSQTSTNGIYFNQNSAGTTTNGLNITRTSGTLTNGIIPP